MNDTLNTTTGSSHNNPRGVPRVKLWIFFVLFLTVGIGMYAGTLYRIRHYGYTGVGQDNLAHPEEVNPAAPTPQN
jgi:hypothetical protein